MKSLSQWVNETFGMSLTIQSKLFASIIIAFVLFLLSRLLISVLSKKVKKLKSRYNWNKGVIYSAYVLFLIIISPIWFSELESMGTFLGLLTAGLAVALKDPISNLFAWIYIIFKKPFEMGDRIQIGNKEGDILDISLFEFTMLEIKNWVKADQSTGRIIHVPNGLVFTKPVTNYNQAMDYIWDEIPILITFESNWKKAKEILFELEKTELKPLIKDAQPDFNEAEQKYFVSYTTLQPTVYTQIKESGVQLTLRFICPPRRRREFEQALYEAILEQFAKHKDITIAYATTRFYEASKEGK